MARQTFWFRDTCLGERQIADTWRPTAGDPPRVQYSFHFWCPECAAIWGRVLHHLPGAYNQVETRYCPHHTKWGGFRGWMDGSLATRSDYHGYPNEFGVGEPWPEEATRLEFYSVLNHILGKPAYLYGETQHA